MRILFLTSSIMWSSNLAVGFKEAGHNVKVSGQLTEEKVIQMIKEFCPHLVITLAWGAEQTDEQEAWVQKYTKKFNIPSIYWSMEDPNFTEDFSIPLFRILQPDFIFTTSKPTVDYFKSLGFKAAYMDFGYSPHIHCRIKEEKPYICDIAVVANAYPHVLQQYSGHYRGESIKTLISPLIKANIQVEFWGRGWEQMGKYIGADIPRECIRGYLPYIDANKVYSSAKIMIGLQNYTDQITQRTYEILGSEGFLLTSDTQKVREMFLPGRDLVVSSSADETADIIKYYLNNPNERDKIRKQGNKTISNHTYKNRAEYMIKVLKEQGILSKL